MATPSQEDYLEAIWRITEKKGYARVTDIAEHLAISQASVSKMIRRLKADGLLNVEKYRGMSLTAKGASQGQALLERHRILENFLRHLALTDPDQILRDVEGIEHFFSPQTLARLAALVSFIDDNPGWWQMFLQSLA